MRNIVKIVLKVVGVLILIGLFFAALNYTYLKRTFTGFSTEQVREVDWFQPQVPMKPALNSSEFIVTENSQNTQESQFSETLAYAESVNTSALLVWQKGELIVEKYWQPYHAESYTQTHSIHKSLLSLVVGIAIEEGAIGSVNDPVSQYLGEWIDQPLGEISIENLLQMTSGLGQEKALIPIFDHFIRLMNSSDISAVAQSLPQAVAPGTEFEYINNNPQLLVDVLEAATGQPYETYLEEKIWSKMAANPGYLWMDRDGGTPHGYCCLIALPEDLLRLGLLVMNKGKLNGEQIVPRQWVEKAISPSALNPNYGYLIWRGSPHTPTRKYSATSTFGVAHSQAYLADDVLFFDGFGGQRVYMVPSLDLVIVRVGETRFDFDDALIPNTVIKAIQEKASKAEEQVKQSDKVYEVAKKDVVIEAPHAKQLKLHVAYPKAESGSFPLIMFSHGHYLTNESYDNLIDRWVEQGYFVVAPLHLDTGEREAVSKLSEDLGSDWVLAARILDMKAIIDQVGELSTTLDSFGGQVRTDKVIAAGHSMGALAAQIIAGATQEVLGNSKFEMPESLTDERVAAVVAISPPGSMAGYLSDKTWHSLSTPQLVVTGTKDVFAYIWTDYRAHLLSYESALPGDNYALVLEGMDHYLGNLIGRLDRDEAPQQQALNDLVDVSFSFMDSYLNGESSSAETSLSKLDAVAAKPGVVSFEKR